MLIWLESLLLFIIMIGYSCTFIWSIARLRDVWYWEDELDFSSIAAITFVMLTAGVIISAFHHVLIGGI